MGEKHNSKCIEKFVYQNPLKKSSLILMLWHHIIIESFIQLKTLYEGPWSSYPLIMDCYKFLDTF
jgi:hypothetical protein